MTSSLRYVLRMNAALISILTRAGTTRDNGAPQRRYIVRHVRERNHAAMGAERQEPARSHNFTEESRRHRIAKRSAKRASNHTRGQQPPAICWRSILTTHRTWRSRSCVLQCAQHASTTRLVDTESTIWAKSTSWRLHGIAQNCVAPSAKL